MSKRGFGRGVWCLMGDFNAIKSHCERKGAASQENRAEIYAFYFVVFLRGVLDSSRTFLCIFCFFDHCLYLFFYQCLYSDGRLYVP